MGSLSSQLQEKESVTPGAVGGHPDLCRAGTSCLEDCIAGCRVAVAVTALAALQIIPTSPAHLCIPIAESLSPQVASRAPHNLLWTFKSLSRDFLPHRTHVSAGLVIGEKPTLSLKLVLRTLHADTNTPDLLEGP